MKRTRMWGSLLWLGLSLNLSRAAEPDFAEFDRRASAGEELRVVFFGASLTWGANATDPALTSYRARVVEMLEARYPRARFKCFDAAIGGTGSQLGVFRLERDVLSRKPDLVFLDFSANDDNWKGSPGAFAAYEALIRRIVAEAGAPVVAVMFPFKWEIEPGVKSGTADHLKGMLRRKEIAAAYGAPAGDAVSLIVARIREGKTTADEVWDTDGVHPGDLGYRLFAEAAFDAFRRGVDGKAVCRAPETMLHADTFMTSRRALLADLFPANRLPEGWTPGRPLLTGGCHDQVMSRWLDRLLVASNRKTVKGEDGKLQSIPQAAARLRLSVQASYVMVFGEATTKSGKFRVFLDGKPRTYTPSGAREPTDLYDMTSKRFGANWNFHRMIADDLDPAAAHTVELEPVLEEGEEQELRIESVCVAGGKAAVAPAPTPAPPAQGE